MAKVTEASKEKINPNYKCWGGTFPSEPKPEQCCICGEPCTKTQQSFMGQILVGFCNEHNEQYSFVYGYTDSGGEMFVTKVGG